MIFGTKNLLRNYNNISINYDNCDIEKVDKFKYLGVILDPLLSWADHIDYVSKTVSERIGVIRRVKFYLPPTTLIMLANALVFPYFDYCSPVWSIVSLNTLKPCKFCKINSHVFSYLLTSEHLWTT